MGGSGRGRTIQCAAIVVGKQAVEVMFALFDLGRVTSTVVTDRGESDLHRFADGDVFLLRHIALFDAFLHERLG